MTIFINPDCLACVICLGPVGDDYCLIDGGYGGVACASCGESAGAEC